MPRFRLPKKTLIICIMLFFAIFTIKNTVTNNDFIIPIRNTMYELLAPLQSGVTKVSQTSSNTFNFFVSYNKLQKENEELKKQLRDAITENSRLEEYRQENIELNLLLDFQKQNEEIWKTEPCQVIARDYNNWDHTITINKGTSNGIKKNMPVVNYEGLVGRVINVTSNTSQVLLIIDSESAVGAIVQSTRVPGVVEAATDEKENLQMVHIPHNAPTPKDAVIITSGLGDIFPKGLRIGYIKNVKIASNGLVKQAHIKPFVDFDSLEEVLVIKEINSRDGEAIEEGAFQH